MKLLRPQLAASEIPDIYTQVSWTSPKFIQPKLDGICCLAVNGVALSRTMKPIPNKTIQHFFKTNKLQGQHGELVVGLDFNETQSFVMSEDKIADYWTFMVYDKWDSTEKYADRMRSQSQLLEDLRRQTTNVGIIPNFLVSNTEGCEYWLDQFVQKGYEGAMLRDPESLYKQGRHTLKSQALLKLKSFHDDEAEIIGFEEKMTNTNVKEKDERGYSKRSSKKEGLVGAGTLGALVVKWKGIEFSIGSGFNDEQRQWIWDNRDKLLGKMVTFKYQELSKYGVPRFPVFKTVRMDI